MMKRKYVSPSVEVVTIVIERGFAASTVENTYAPEGEAGMLQEGNTYEW